MPRLPANAKRLNARACVSGVESSVNMVRIVLEACQCHCCFVTSLK